MGSLNIDLGNGDTRRVTVDDSFADLSAEDQAQAVHSIATTLRGAGAGLSADQLQGRAQQARRDIWGTDNGQNLGPSDTSYGSALMYGVHNAAAGFGSTAKVAGDAAGLPGLTGAGQAVAGAVGAPQGYDPAGPKVAEGFRHGDWREIVSNLPRAAIETAPDLLGTVAAGALGSLAGPVGGAAGVMAYNAGRTFGDTAEARAANNQHLQPTAGDLAGAGLTTLATGALQAAGVGRVPGVAGAIEAAPTVLRPVASAAAEGLGAAGANLAQQAGNTAGTDRGIAVDPAEAAAAGAQGAVARFGQSALPVVAQGAQAAARAATGAMLPRPSADEAASIARVNTAADNLREQTQSTGRAPSDQAVLDTLHSRLQTNASEIGRQLRQVGAITEADHRGVIQPAIREAATATDAGPLPYASAVAELAGC